MSTPASTSQGSSSTSASRHGRRTPAERRTPTSQKRTSSAKTGTKYSALHFTPQAQPSSTPAASRHHGQVRQPVGGRPARPGWLGSSPSSSARSPASPAGVPVEHQRAERGQHEEAAGRCRAARCGTAPGGSRPGRSAGRRRSRARSSGTSGRPIRTRIRIDSVPATAAENRQPNSACSRTPTRRARSATCPAAGAPRTPGRCPCQFHSTPCEISP